MYKCPECGFVAHLDDFNYHLHEDEWTLPEEVYSTFTCPNCKCEIIEEELEEDE